MNADSNDQTHNIMDVVVGERESTGAFCDVILVGPFASGNERADALFLFQRWIENDAELLASASFRDGRHDVQRAGPGILTFFHIRQPLDGRE